MNNLKELSELAWQGELDTKFEHHPVHTFYEGSTELAENLLGLKGCLLYTSPSPRDATLSRMPSSA